MKEIRVILSPEAEEVYKKLNAEAENNKQSRMILKASISNNCTIAMYNNGMIGGK